MAREQRKLAAILAADVVGYSRLKGCDESGTVARRALLPSRRPIGGSLRAPGRNVATGAAETAGLEKHRTANRPRASGVCAATILADGQRRVRRGSCPAGDRPVSLRCSPHLALFETAHTSLVLPVCGVGWTLAFLLYWVACGPILARPRSDAHPSPWNFRNRSP